MRRAFSPNQRAGGDVGIPRVWHAERAQPAAPHHDRWPVYGA